MEKFRDIGEYSFGWLAEDHKTRLLLPEATRNIRAFATVETARRGASKCKACGSRISKDMNRCVFRWLQSNFGWSRLTFVHARAEDCTKVEVWDAQQQAQYHARGITG
jgi:hypothetical protein